MSASLLLLAPLALCAGGIALVVLRASPRASFVAWTIVLFFVPIWVGVTAGFFWAAIILMTLAAIAANLGDLRLAPVDAIVAAFAVLVVVLHALGMATLSATVIAVLQWVVPYVWGRIVLSRVDALFVTRTIAIAATAAAILALVEFALQFNVFALVPGPGAYELWASSQSRASLLRAEGAFGHAIALGAALSMSSAFILAARWRPLVTLLALLAVAAALVVTFSRIGLVAGAITVALSLMLLPGLRARTRWSIAASGVAVIAVVLPLLGGVFAEAGDEAAGSAAYRTGQLSLLSEVRLLGDAGDWSGRVSDGVYLGAFAHSIDNTLLLIAVRFGWVAVLLVVAVLAGVVLGMVGRPANPAAVAVAAQLPSLVAVALITQFGLLLWFVVGLAVAWHDVDRTRAARDRAALSLRAPARRLPAAGAAPSIA